jgi:hypothetical protein
MVLIHINLLEFTTILFDWLQKSKRKLLFLNNVQFKQIHFNDFTYV